MLEFTFPMASIYFGSYLHVYWYAVVCVPPYSCLLSVSGEKYFLEFNCMYQATWWKDLFCVLTCELNDVVILTLLFVLLSDSLFPFGWTLTSACPLWMDAHVGVGYGGR